MPIWILLLWPLLAQGSLDSRDANLQAARAYVAQGNLQRLKLWTWRSLRIRIPAASPT